METSVVEEEGVCPECYGIGIADMDQHMRSVHNKVPVIQADTGKLLYLVCISIPSPIPDINEISNA